MSDEKLVPPAPGDHQSRVHAAFDDLESSLGDRITADARRPLEQLRGAALEKDADGIRGHIESVKERHGWLYEELSKHPGVAALVNELALMGL
jgi:hypothetical protein